MRGDDFRSTVCARPCREVAHLDVLVVETDNGWVLGQRVGAAGGDNLRVQPGVSDAADRHRPFYS